MEYSVKLHTTKNIDPIFLTSCYLLNHLFCATLYIRHSEKLNLFAIIGTPHVKVIQSKNRGKTRIKMQLSVQALFNYVFIYRVSRKDPKRKSLTHRISSTRPATTKK